jgi:hypothetical protein
VVAVAVAPPATGAAVVQSAPCVAGFNDVISRRSGSLTLPTTMRTRELSTSARDEHVAHDRNRLALGQRLEHLGLHLHDVLVARAAIGHRLPAKPHPYTGNQQRERG